MQLTTEEFLIIQNSLSSKEADNTLLQKEVERLAGEVKRLSEENSQLRANQAPASPAEVGKPGYLLISVDAVCNLFRSLRDVNLYRSFTLYSAS